jgi:hypothetical protein
MLVDLERSENLKQEPPLQENVAQFKAEASPLQHLGSV